MHPGAGNDARADDIDHLPTLLVGVCFPHLKCRSALLPDFDHPLAWPGDRLLQRQGGQKISVQGLRVKAQQGIAGQVLVHRLKSLLYLLHQVDQRLVDVAQMGFIQHGSGVLHGFEPLLVVVELALQVIEQ
ncbi:hypothetical protein D3C76_928720 [compost metagenome]